MTTRPERDPGDTGAPASPTPTPVIGLTRRGLLGAAGGLAAVAGLAACGGNTGRGSGSNSASPTPSNGSGGKTAAGKTDGGKTGGGAAKPNLSQWYHQYGEKGTEQAVKRYAAAYHKANVTVQWTLGDYDKKVATSLLTNNGPDVFENGNGPSLDMIQGKQVVPLTDVIGSAKSDFSPGVIAPMIYQGEVWGIPQVTDMQMLYYRKSLLKDAGVKPPKTFAELADAAAATTKNGVKGLFLSNAGGVDVLGGTVLWAAGLDYFRNGKVAFDNPTAESALADWHTLFDSGHLLLGAPADWSAPDAFLQELCAMQWTGLWNFPQIKAKFGDDFGVLPFPKVGSKGEFAVPVGAFASCVNAKSAHVDAAKAFAAWLWVKRTDFQLDFAQSYGFHIPARKSLAAKATKLKHGAAADSVKFVNEYGHANPLTWTPKASTAFTDALTRVVKSGADPKQQLAAAAKVAQKELDRVNG